MRQGEPQRDGRDLFHAAHHELRQSVRARLLSWTLAVARHECDTSATSIEADGGVRDPTVCRSLNGSRQQCCMAPLSGVGQRQPDGRSLRAMMMA